LKLAEATAGSLETSEDREAFYRRATHSRETFLVKTHEPPLDAQKAIHVVRDGRLALASFARFQELVDPGNAGLCSLLFGHPAFGNWTSHYRAWQGRRRGEVLLVRFEGPVACPRGLLERLAGFLGHRGPVRDWENPQRHLQEALPEFFGEGRVRWERGLSGATSTWACSARSTASCSSSSVTPAPRRHGAGPSPRAPSRPTSSGWCAG
jgi:hypothetical protein